MTIILAHTASAVIPAIVRTSEIDRWLAERTEAMAVLGVTRVDRIDLKPGDVE